jgi:hypothetical protein
LTQIDAEGIQHEAVLLFAHDAVSGLFKRWT